jgi:hypothetical protein
MFDGVCAENLPSFFANNASFVLVIQMDFEL